MSTPLEQKQQLRAHLLASLVIVEGEIKQMQQVEKKPKKDYSAIDARELQRSMRKFKKVA